MAAAVAVEQRHLDRIASAYQARVQNAYNEYAATLDLVPRETIDAGISPHLLRDKPRMRDGIKRAAGALGAAIGAAKKWAKRELVFFTLRRARDDAGLDVTPTAAYHVAERVLGRGISMRAANDQFGQPERTAADKTYLTAHHLADIEATLRTNLDALELLLNHARNEQRRTWHSSSQRRAILDGWREVLRDAPDDLPVI